MLLAMALGSVLALPASGPVVTHFGSRRTVAVTSAISGVGMITIGIGHLGGVVPLLIGLFVSGFVMALWDVAMNIQGALVEQRLGRSIMSRFHAGFSIGTVAAALIGTAMVGLGVPVAVHLTFVCVAVAIGMPRVTRA